MSEDPEKAPEKIEMFPIGYVENDYLEPVYDEKVYQDVSKIVLEKELADGLYRLEDFESRRQRAYI
jgi:tRNA (Thr-GGU) A37 N-methylase